MTPTKDQQAQEYAEKKFPELLLTIEKEPWPKTREILAKAYTDGYATCEQSMSDSEATVIKGWVCRDKKDNCLNLHAEKPYRTYSHYNTDDKSDWWESDCASFLPLDKTLFPSLAWESDPVECEIIIKPKKR